MLQKIPPKRAFGFLAEGKKKNAIEITYSQLKARAKKLAHS